MLNAREFFMRLPMDKRISPVNDKLLMLTRKRESAREWKDGKFMYPASAKRG